MKSARARLLATLAVGVLISSPPLKAQSYYNYAGTYAVDAKGVRHGYQEYPRHRPPWVQDQIKAFAPVYPYSDRAAHREGHGFFRIMIDPRTGSVVTVTVVKSTGFKTLDDAAVQALGKWYWKPGKWKEVYVPVTFTLGQRRSMPSGAIPLHSRW